MRPFDGTFDRFDLPGNVTLHVAPSAKFKTAIVKTFLRTDLTEERATPIALLPSVLRRGTRKLPSQRALTRHLEALYGTQLGGDVMKFGEQQVVTFKAEVPGDSFLPEGTNAFAQAIELLGDLMHDPALDAQGLFPAPVVAQEKDKQRQFIDALVNDKGAYAYERCARETCKGEPFAIYEYGANERLATLTPAELTETWRSLGRCKLDVFALGAIESERARDAIARVFERRGRSPEEPLRGTIPNPAPREAREIREAFPVKQAKLCMALRTPARIQDPAYFATFVMNGVLGAYAHSKLFRHVREKAGLCYYASSHYERTKGLLFIQAGIEHAHFEKTRDLCLAQLDAIRKGEVTDEEIDSTRRAMRLSYRSLLDRPAQLANTVYALALGNRNVPLAEVADRAQAVTKDEIVAAAHGVWLDCVYLLEPDGTVTEDEDDGAQQPPAGGAE